MIHWQDENGRRSVRSKGCSLAQLLVPESTAKCRPDVQVIAVRLMPNHGLSRVEQAQLLAVASEPRSSAVPSARSVPMLADLGQACAPKQWLPLTPRLVIGSGKAWCCGMRMDLPAKANGRWLEINQGSSSPPARKVHPVPAMLIRRGIKSSSSRFTACAVSADAESLLRTAKCRSDFFTNQASVIPHAPCEWDRSTAVFRMN